MSIIIIIPTHNIIIFKYLYFQSLVFQNIIFIQKSEPKIEKNEFFSKERERNLFKLCLFFMKRKKNTRKAKEII
jgi:hypothetical protein